MKPYFTPYEVGRQWEYAVKEKYEKLGFEVTRAASSQGRWDLICVRPGKIQDISDSSKPPLDGHIILVQCKAGASKRRIINSLKNSGIKQEFEGVYRVTVSLE